MEQITGLPLELNIHNQNANRFIKGLRQHHFPGVNMNVLNYSQQQIAILPDSIIEAKRQGYKGSAKDLQSMLHNEKKLSEKRIKVIVWLYGDDRAQITTAIDKIRTIAYENKVIKFPNEVAIKPNDYIKFSAKIFGARPEDEDISKLSATIELQF